jgi:DNA-binding NtrC family response regulator
MVILSRGPELDADAVPPHISRRAPPPPAGTTAVGAADFEAADRATKRRVVEQVVADTLEQGVREGGLMELIEKEVIRRALALNQGNRPKTAKMLGIAERTLYRKIKEYELS